MYLNLLGFFVQVVTIGIPIRILQDFFKNTSAFCDKKTSSKLFSVCSLILEINIQKDYLEMQFSWIHFSLSTAFVSIMKKNNAWQIMRNGSSQKECRLCILPVRIDFYNWHDLHNVKIRTWLKASRPVNLHPIFLFWKHGSVCDPVKKGAKCGLQKAGYKKTGSLLFKKRRCQTFF